MAVLCEKLGIAVSNRHASGFSVCVRHRTGALFHSGTRLR
jgi:hypothetical protein